MNEPGQSDSRMGDKIYLAGREDSEVKQEVFYELTNPSVFKYMDLRIYILTQEQLDYMLNHFGFDVTDDGGYICTIGPARNDGIDWKPDEQEGYP
jgi:hypothetical protein